MSYLMFAFKYFLIRIFILSEILTIKYLWDFRLVLSICLLLIFQNSSFLYNTHFNISIIVKRSTNTSMSRNLHETNKTFDKKK